MHYTSVSLKGFYDKCHKKKRVDCVVAVAKVLVVLVKSGVCLEQCYIKKIGSYGVFVVYGGRGIHYGWIVKRGYIFV